VQIVLLLQGHGGNNMSDEALMRCMTRLPRIYISYAFDVGPIIIKKRIKILDFMINYHKKVEWSSRFLVTLLETQDHKMCKKYSHTYAIVFALAASDDSLSGSRQFEATLS
jgi:hypothetical protein